MQITTQQQLDEICKEAETLGCFGFDSEFIPENTYYPKLALIQLAVGSSSYIVDPLGPLDLSPLERLMHSPDVITIVHAGAQDMAIFFNRTHVAPKRVFDTQIAAAFLGMGHQVSYAGLVHQLFGVTLKKGQSYTNWLLRPLTPAQITYALEDVVYLIEAYQKLVSQLEERGRLLWVSDELQHYEQPQFYLEQAENPERRVKKTTKLKGGELAILKGLADWRELEAQRKNLPRKKILSDNAVVDLVKRKPRTEHELLSIRSVGPSLRRYAKPLVDVIAASRDKTPLDAAEKNVVSLGDEQRLVVDFLVFCLKVFCEREGLTSSYLATKSELESLVRDYFAGLLTDSNHRVLQGWRKTAVGDDLLKCLEGKLGVKHDAASGGLCFFE